MVHTQGGYCTVHTRYTHREAYTEVHYLQRVHREAYTEVYPGINHPGRHIQGYIPGYYPPREAILGYTPPWVYLPGGILGYVPTWVYLPGMREGITRRVLSGFPLERGDNEARSIRASLMRREGQRSAFYPCFPLGEKGMMRRVVPVLFRVMREGG